MTNFTIKATARSDEGKGASRRLRHAGQFPAVVYGADKDAQSIAVEHNTFWNMIGNQDIFSSVIALEVDGTTENVVIKDLQRHPFKNLVMHMDLQRVTDETVIVKSIPLMFLNTDTNPGSKLGGVTVPLLTEVEVRCAAKNLPTSIQVDCGDMENQQSKRMSHIDLPEGVELTALARGSDYDHGIVMVTKARKAR